VNDRARNSFAERILNLRNEASMSGLFLVVENLDKALSELLNQVRGGGLPAEGRFIYDLIMEEMLDRLSDRENVSVFPSSRVNRMILSEDQIQRFDPRRKT
jgi:hypothetical protein